MATENKPAFKNNNNRGKKRRFLPRGVMLSLQFLFFDRIRIFLFQSFFEFAQECRVSSSLVTATGSDKPQMKP
ncbi:hypothetical protein KFK09_000867 [Dendrobium nobile]|uniref:Uncharacterized protein n=1 Tax=Dendrobium nobile TaxID=94219 RepID=A0A8T3C9P1_DENNO|nr:hypothetical protein KFK09_000867 [Dendrobium nobile]